MVALLALTGGLLLIWAVIQQSAAHRTLPAPATHRQCTYARGPEPLKECMAPCGVQGADCAQLTCMLCCGDNANEGMPTGAAHSRRLPHPLTHDKHPADTPACNNNNPHQSRSEQD